MTAAGPPPADERAAIVSTAEQTPIRSPARPRASAATAAQNRAHQPSLALPAPPGDGEKYCYIHRNLPYLTVTLAVSAACLIVSQARFAMHSPATWAFALLTVTYLCYQAISLPVNFTGRGFSVAAHRERVLAWRPAQYPSVDILLPICGEPIEVLRNTWTAVFELVAAYPGPAGAYVLDDGPSDEARSVSESFGFRYLRRPDLRSYKKSGNLRYAFGRTSGEFIVIFDADFAPRRDFLAETLPYTDDPAVAIVQTPQFFRQSAAQTWIENAAGAIQEVFYRAIQVARDRFGAAICVGTSAVYRRAALEPQGGPTLIPYAEDVHTGLDVRRSGWSVVYVPVVLSAGICPDNLDAFVRQQYRWCTGNAGVVFSRRLWSVPMSIPARLTYISGFFYYAYTGLLTFFGPGIPIVLLAFLPGQVRLRNFVILGPAMAAGFVLYPLWHRARYGPSVWPLGVARGWAHVFSIWDSARGRTMGWQPTRTPGGALRRFRVWVTAWSGGTAALWVILAIWRTVTLGPARFGILLVFGALNLAIVSRVIFPGAATA
jgi:cellulose synthase/poly-beta-1,6-N-acetylglucosamine synthase-like glycosyltransferase